MEQLVQTQTTLPSPSSVSSGDSIELERDAYKEKIEHFKVLIRSLQQELHSYKIRKEGTETVSKLLQESRHENQVLQRKNRTLYSAVRNLQCRLENNGLSSEVTLQEDEPYVPGCSKQLLDNLTRENNRLRGLIRNASGDPEEVQRLIQEVKRQEDRVTELETILGSSGDQKDRTITELRQSLEHVQREFTSRDSLCTSLAEEAAVLRTQLQEVAQRCQEMAKRLEESEITTKKLKETSAKSPVQVPGEMSRLTVENQELRAKLTEISQMNNRWQAYSSEREGQLQNKITQLREELQQVQASRSSASAAGGGADVTSHQAAQEYAAEMNKVLDEARSNEERFKREKESYQRQLDQAHAQIYQLAEQSQQLSQQLKQAGRRLSREDSETMEALKQQVQVCTEDFESERRDREKAQARIARLETENEQLKREKREWQQQQQNARLYNPTTGYNDTFQNYNLPVQQGHYQNENTLAARGVSPRPVDYQNVVDCKARDMSNAVPAPAPEDREQTRVVELKPNTPSEQFLSLRTSSMSPVNESRPQTVQERTSPQLRLVDNRRSNKAVEMLKCPKCDKEYHPEQHGDLLEHIEECCE